MKNRIFAICLMLFCSVIAFFGCSEEPYENMAMTIQGLDNNAVHLFIRDELIEGKLTRTYESREITVTVTDESETTDLGIVVYGGGYIVYTDIVDLGGGVTSIKLTARAQGSTSIHILSKEGNITQIIDVVVQLEINDMEFNHDKVSVIRQGYNLDLTNYQELLKYSPVDTAQKDVIFEIMTPIDSMTMPNGEKYSYAGTSEMIYATIENNTLLKTYKNAIFPVNMTTGKSVVTLKVTSKYNADIYDYVDFEVVNVNDDIHLFINGDVSAEPIELMPNKYGYYEIVLANPSYDLGVSGSDYLYNRDLFFYVDYGGHSDNNYRVMTDLILDSDGSHLSLSGATESELQDVYMNQYNGVFHVQAVKEGPNRSHTFYVEHKSHIGKFTQEIKVTFVVKNFTKDIEINSSTKADDGYIYVYDTYSTGVLGSSINVNLKPYYVGQTYYVCFPSQFLNSMSLVKSSGKVIGMGEVIDNGGVLTFDLEDAMECSIGATVFLKHKYNMTPEEDVIDMYIITYFDLASSEYENNKEGFFKVYPVYDKVQVKIVKGMTDISIEFTNYKLSVTNDEYINTGIKLVELPQGNSFENTIDSIEYVGNKDVCYIDLVYENDICSLVLKINDDHVVGNVDVTITTINGLTKTLNVQTYIPVVYPNSASVDFDDRWVDDETIMPMNVEIDTKNPGYLGDMSLLHTIDETTGDIIYDTDASSSTKSINVQNLIYDGTSYYVEDWGFTYTTFTDVVLATNSEFDLNVYNYLLYVNGNKKLYNKILVNEDISVSYSILNYVKWENGKLYTYNNRTTNKNNPVRLALTYTGFVEYVDGSGEYVAHKVKINHTINIWVYDIISNVVLNSAKSITLYDSSSLGYYDAGGSSYVIDVDVAPGVENLGGWVSESNSLYGVNMLYNVTDKVVRTVYNDNMTNKIDIMLSDLYVIEGNTIRAEVGQRLIDWVYNDPNITLSVEEIVSMVYRDKVAFSVNIYVTQFNKTTAINSILVTLDYAKTINNIYLDADRDEGLYFEVRDSGVGGLMANPSKVTLNYTISPEIVYNTNVRLINYITASYYVAEGNVVNGGKFDVIPRLSAGEYDLIIAAEDSFNSFDNTTFYYNTSTSIKIKVADGSKNYPFEIRTVQDFEQMLLDIKEGRNYHYILVNDINLAGYKFKNYTFKNTSDEFVLDGEYEYVSNGVTMYRYSTIYGLNVHIDSAATEMVIDNASDYVNLGLFTSIPQNAVIKNMTFKNTSLDVTLSATYRNKIYNVGVLSGLLLGSVENTQIFGNVSVSLNMCNYANIGGMVGYLGNTARYYGVGVNVDGRISGNPVLIDSHISDSSYNANISFELKGTNDITSGINIGGVVGFADVAGYAEGNLNKLNVAMSIKTSLYTTIGGVVGRANGLDIKEVTVLPIIWNDTDVDGIVDFTNVNIGGFIGKSVNSTIVDSRVYFNDLGDAFVGLNSAAIYANGNVGGMIGYSTGDTILYSYVRSFYDKVITVDVSKTPKVNYYGNIVLISKGSVGGISGIANNISISNSYVDADIASLTRLGISIAGLLGQNLSTVKTIVSNTYVLGQVVIVEDDVLYNGLTDIAILFGGDTATLVRDSLVEYSVTVTNANTEISNSYAIVNSSYYTIIKNFRGSYTMFYELGKTLEYVYKYDILKETSSETHYTSFEIFGGVVFQFGITDGQDFYKNGNLSPMLDTTTSWFVSSDESVHINSVTIGAETASLPVITRYENNTFKLLYDIVPSNMSANIPECTVFTSKAHLNISKTIVDTSTGTTSFESQVILFYNEDNDGLNAYNEYLISVSTNNSFAETSVINISLNSNILSTTFVDIELNNKVVLSESSSGTIIRLVNNVIYTMGEGLVTLRVSSIQDASVYKDIHILVVKGISDFVLYDYESEVKDPVQNTDGIYSPDSLETIYIDTYKYYKFEPLNHIVDNNGVHSYIPNENIGYMLEVLETNESVKISIDGVDVSYRTDASNIYLFDDIDSMLISGVGFSEDDSFIYFKITPYIIFNGMYDIHDDFYIEKLYVDTNNFITSRPARASAYMFEEGGFWCLRNCVLVPELSHSYAFRVVAKAYSIDFGSNLDEVNISPLATFKTSLNLVTSNVNISSTFICEECGSVVVVDDDVKCDNDTCGKTYDRININNVRLLENMNMYLVGKDSFELYKGDLSIFNSSKISLSLKDRYLNSFLGTVVSSGLVEFTFENISITKVKKEDHAGQHDTNSYMISFSVVVNFNQNLYKNNADKYDLNNLNYVWIFVPETNVNIESPAIMKIGIEPLSLSTIIPRFYPNAEGLSAVSQIEIPKEYESEYIVRNRKGLMKLSLNPEFNNSSYVTVTADNSLKSMLNIGQMSALISNTGISSYVSGYDDVIYRHEVETPGRYGIRLSKLSTNYRNDILFDNIYYVSLLLNAGSSMVGADISVYITSYRLINGVAEPTYEIEVPLKVYDLPEISISLKDGNKSGFVAVGSSVEVDVNIENYTGSTIPFSFVIPSVDNDGKFYFVNDLDEIIRNEFSIEYLNSGRKYYLCADASAKYSAEHNTGIETFKVQVKVQETIMGSVETVSDILSMQVVEMAVNDIEVGGTIYSNDRNEMQILHGESIVLSVILDVNDVRYGDSKTLNDLLLKNNIYYPNVSVDSKGQEIVFGTKETLEYLFAGTSVQLTKQNDSTGWINYVTGGRNDNTFKIWYLDSEFNGNKEYVAIDVGAYDNFNVMSSSYRYSTEKYIADYLLYAIKGTTISENTVLKCAVTYYYDNSGIIRLGYSNVYNTYELDFEFTLIVEDNSTYDHPNPIENEYDLAHMESDANYILINNIEVENWVPYVANFATLDGNGYTIKVKSFDFDTIRGSEGAKYAGLFSEISENTVIKNVMIDVSELLISESEMLANLDQARQDVDRLDKIDTSGYKSSYDIDLSLIMDVSFGMLAGLNKGSITNVKLISTKDIGKGANYLHVVTSQAYIGISLTNSKIGGIVGINEGAISNSSVGLNYSSLESMGISYVEMVTNASSLTYSNVDDEISEAITYPFIIAGGNTLAGIVAENKGILSNSYVKGIGLYNTFPIVELSSTGGIVADNTTSGYVTSSFIEGYTIENYRASTTDDYFIESTGNIGGFVYSNSGVIENAYSNISLKTQSSYTGGFVYINNVTGVINYAYSTAVSRQSQAHGQFTGVFVNKVQNYGLYTSCFYLVALENETVNVNEPATAIETYSEYSLSNTVGYAFSDVDTWNGFAFVSGNNNDSIWTMPDINSTNNGSELKGPQINATLTDTISFRRLSNREDIYVTDSFGNIMMDENGNWMIESTEYEYEYNTYALGSKENPLIIDTAQNFVTYIIDNTDTYTNTTYTYQKNANGRYVLVGDTYVEYNESYLLYDRYNRIEHTTTLYVFGAGSLAHVGSNSIVTNINDVQYVRLVNNLDFSNVVFANAYKGIHLYDIIFAGSLDGNGMTMSSLNLTVDNMTRALENFGLFAQIGLSESDIAKITGVTGITSELQSAVKNVKVTVRTYKSNGASKAGVLAGTINNSSIVNIEVTAENDTVIVSGVNMSGVLAGLIYSDNNYTVNDSYASASNYSIVRLIDIKIKNIQVEATYNSLGGTLDSTSEVVDGSYYTRFNILINHANTQEVHFNSIYNRDTGKTDLSRTSIVSYAGMVAGVISVNNYVREVGYHGVDDDINEYDRYIYYRTTPSETIIRNIVVSEGAQIKTADNAGGLFGYIGENTHIKESQFVLSDGKTQYIKGNNFVGGIVGENHGILEQVYVAYDDAVQDGIDKDIYNPSRRVSGDYIFGLQNEISYTVAVGGIAGYSSTGVILDTYSKVNVVKDHLYIAGGLIGYAEDYNYIAYAYTTGAVYSSYVTGGLIGFYKYTLLEDMVEPDVYTYGINEKHFLYMKSVVSLANWSYTSGDIDVQSKIGYVLYSNYSVLYTNGNAGFYDFTITMPEIGNQKIKSYLQPDFFDVTGTYQMVDTTDASIYYARHSSQYVGSAIGRALYSTVDDDFNAVPSDREQFDVNNKTSQYVFVDNFYETTYPDIHDVDYDLKNLGVKYFSGVYTDTYGSYMSSGTTGEGNKNDSFSGGYSIQIGNTAAAIESFKITGTGYKYKDLANTGLQLSEVEGDVLYDKIFSGQEYLQQIIGYYGSTTDGGTGENQYKNLFTNRYYAKDRYAYDLSNIEDVDWLNGAFISGNMENDYTNNIWKVVSYIPSKSFGIYGNIKYISNSQELIQVFSEANNNMTYYIQEQENGAPYEINVNTGGDNYSLYRFTNTFTGALRALDTDKKIRIVVNFGDASDYAVALFRELNSASFYNIKFELNINASIDVSSDRYGYMGMFANRVISTQFQNCEFRVNVVKTDSMLKVKSSGTKTAEYFGLLFGYVSGVNMYAADIVVNVVNTVDVLDKTLVIDDAGLNVKNVSLAMGFVTNTTLNEIVFRTIHNGNNSNKGLTLVYNNNSALSELNIGGVIATVKNSDISFKTDVYETGVGFVFTSEKDSMNNCTGSVNIGGMVANASYTKLRNLVYNASIEVVRTMPTTRVSVGGIVGLSTNNTLYNSKVSMIGNNTRIDTPNNTIKLSNNMGVGTSTGVVTDIAIGGIVGTNTAGTVIGEIGAVDENTISNIDIEVILGDNVINDENILEKIHVGGLVGSTGVSTSLLNRAINIGDIKVMDQYNTRIESSKGIGVGGLVGSASGTIGLNYVYNAGNITTIFAQRVNRLSVGGLVGYASGNININSFANYGDIDGGYGEITVEGVTLKGGFATNVGGIVGCNDLLTSLSDGYSFGNITNYNKNVVMSSVVGGNVATESENVFFIQEFINNNYDTDSLFTPIVYADLYDTATLKNMLNNNDIDEKRYTDIDTLTKCGFTAIKEGRLFVYVIDGLVSPFTNGLKKIKSEISDMTVANGKKYNPYIVSATDNTLTEFSGYNVVLTNIVWDNNRDIEIGEGVIISGKTQRVHTGVSDEYITTVATLKDYRYPFAKVNRGVISNLSIYRSETTDVDYDYTGDFAYGIIENYGTLYKVNTVTVSHTSGTTSTSAFVSYNEGNILASGAISLQKYLYTDPANSVFTSYSGFVWSNVGFISDSYSTSYLYGDIKEGIQSLNYSQYVFGLVAQNGIIDADGNEKAGIIKYSYHYMRDVMDEDSDTVLYVNGRVENYRLIGGSIGANSLELYVLDKVEIQVLPTWVSARNVWKLNSDETYNYGYPYIKNTYITGTVVVSIVDISSIIQNKLYADEAFSSDDLSIQYSFFKNMNDENSVIVNTPSKLYNILNSAINSTLSNQTILITSDLDMTGFDLNGVISYSYATIVGAVLEGVTYRNAKISNFNINGGSLFGSNYGIVAFLDFENINVTGDGYVAPICVYNKGTISHINIRNGYISGNSYVGGIASYNSVPSNLSTNIGIYYVNLTNVEIYNGSSSGYTGGICAINEGSTTKNYKYGIINSGVTDISIYALGSYCGGIVGRNSGKIVDVIVRGSGSGSRVILSVTGGSYVGGIAGYTTVEISGTTNSVGNVNITGNNYIGGYYGYSLSNISNANISNVNITASVKNSLGESYAGGLVGFTSSNIIVGKGSAIMLSNIDISAYGYYVGGLVGYMSKKFGSIKISQDEGVLLLNEISIRSGSAYVGGILGKARDNNVVISGYSDTYKIKITGYLDIKTQYVNSETAYIGGIVSAVESTDNENGSFVSNISYIDINAPISIESSQVTSSVGGIVGYVCAVNMVNNTISKTYDVTINTPKANSVGGVVGHFDSDVNYTEDSCIFEIGLVKIVAVSYIGAYIGYVGGDLYVDKNITISGTSSNYVDIRGNSSAGNIGGVFGYIVGDVVLDSKINLSYVRINSNNEVYAGVYYGGVFGNILGTLSLGENAGFDLKFMNLYGNSYVGTITGKVSFVEDNAVVGNINISDIVIRASSNYVGGVFGYVTGNVNITNTISINKVSLDGNYYVGGMMGFVGGNTTVGATTSITASDVNGYNNVGGFIGCTSNASMVIILSGSSVKVVETSVLSGIGAGGLVYSTGYIYVAGGFEFTKSIIKTTTSYSDSGTVGGVAGVIHRSLIVTGMIKVAGNSTYYNEIKGYKYAGGLIGYINFGNSSHIENDKVGKPSIDNVNDILYANIGIYIYGGDVNIAYTNIEANQYVGGMVGQTNGNIHIQSSSIVNIEKSTIKANTAILSYAGGLIGIKYNSRIFVYNSRVRVYVDDDKLSAKFDGHIIGYDGRYSIYVTSLYSNAGSTISVNVDSAYYYGAVSYN